VRAGTPRHLARVAGRGLLVREVSPTGAPRPSCCCAPLGALLKGKQIGPGRQSEPLWLGTVTAGCPPGAALLAAQRARRVLAGLVVLRWTPRVTGAGEFVLKIIIIIIIFFRLLTFTSYIKKRFFPMAADIEAGVSHFRVSHGDVRDRGNSEARFHFENGRSILVLWLKNALSNASLFVDDVERGEFEGATFNISDSSDNRHLLSDFGDEEGVEMATKHRVLSTTDNT
jgi:hypothetical protein